MNKEQQIIKLQAKLKEVNAFINALESHKLPILQEKFNQEPNGTDRKAVIFGKISELTRITEAIKEITL